MAKKRKRRRRRDQELLKILIPAIGAVLGVSLLAAVVLVLTDKKSEPVLQEETDIEQTEGGAAEDEKAFRESETPETEDRSTSEAETEEAKGSQDDGAGGKEAGPSSDSQMANEAAADAPAAVAAEVGSMEDKEDPQKSANAAGSGSGAAQDVSSVQLSENEVAAATLGIDVSKYQGTIDWAKVKEAGVEFAMIRVGYRTKTSGLLYEDPGARYNLQEATKNGIKAGAYFFSTAVNEQEAKEEAAWVADFIARYKITYPVAYNCEDFTSADSRQNQLTKAERTKIACAFLDTIAAQGYTPMFYASRNEMEGSAQWDMVTLGSKYKVWVSQYPEKPFPETPKSTYSGTHAMWQYTSKGKVAGIKGNVDVNVAYFGYSQEAEAKDSTPAEQVLANPEVGIDFTEVNDTVTAKNETNLRDIPSTENSTVIHLLKNGETLQRTGIGSNGWDRLIYNGHKVYAVHNFLTEDLEAGPQDEGGSAAQTADTTVEGQVFKSVNEAVTARDKVNLRDKPSTETGAVVGTLSYGEAVVRTGISGSADSGWSRLLVNGQTVYASSRLLATSMDYKETEKPSADDPERGMHFTAASGTVKAKDGKTNLRTLPTTNEPSQVVTQLTGDDTAQRIAVDKDKGWTKVSYNGQTLYAVSNYLTVTE